MAITVGTANVSPTQDQLLREATQALPTPLALERILMVLRDEDITSGRETVHPEWRNIFEVHQQMLESRIPPEELADIKQKFGLVKPYDDEVLTIDLRTSRITFLLGAGASKASPSDIPTVKELLPDLLQRARRLGRQDLDRLAEFCERSKLDNIEDLLTAAQLSEFCSRNPNVLELIQFLIYRREDRAGVRFDPRFRQRLIGDLSAVAFLQDTLQVLFGLLSSRMLPAEPNKAH